MKNIRSIGLKMNDTVLIFDPLCGSHSRTDILLQIYHPHPWMNNGSYKNKILQASHSHTRIINEDKI